MAAEPVGVVDFAYLEDFMAGDKTIVLEVLALFTQQAQLWAPRLDSGDPAWRDTLHTIKGVARGVGAAVLGDLCAEAEARGEAALPLVREGLAAALAEIEAYRLRV